MMEAKAGQKVRIAFTLNGRGVNAENGGNVQGIASVLFTNYVFAFEATSILILVAMVGSILLARRESER